MMINRGKGSTKPVGTREWYDFVGLLADIIPGLHLGGKEATEALLEMCQLDAESRVLDVGCGSGHTACLINQKYGSWVQGIDISAVMIEQAKARARRQGLTDKVEFRTADVYRLSFEDGTFDVVIAESVLTPLPGDKKQALKEMVRVIRPGGLVAINESTVDPSAPPELLELFAEHPAVYGYFTSQLLGGLFAEAGLEVMQMTENKSMDAPSASGRKGLLNLLSFMIRTYPKILFKLLRDRRFRKASRIDDQLTKRGKPHMGYSLIVGRKPG